MATATIRTELKKIAERLPANATYEDAMYALYVRMKIARGRQEVREGKTISHDTVRRKFLK